MIPSLIWIRKYKLRDGCRRGSCLSPNLITMQNFCFAIRVDIALG